MTGIGIDRRARVLLPLAVAAVLFVCWELAVRATHSQGLLPIPSGVFASGVRLTSSGVIFDAMSGSLKRVLIGFLIGGSLGIPLGLAIGTIPALDRALRPVLDGLRSIAFGRTLELRWPEHPDFPSYGYVVTRKDLDELAPGTGIDRLD